MGDLLFELSQWLYTTPLNAFAQGVSESRLSAIVVSWFWAIPLMQTVHILAIAATLVAVLMLNLRVFGLAGHATLQETAQRYTKVLWWALVFVAITGVGMLFGDTVRNLLNSVFWIKMALLIIGVAMALGYSRNLARQTVGGGQAASAVTKTTGIVLIALWCVIILAGRWIAYAPS
jgi:undecaprenyl pyrophosphate phosphatase UppP